MSELHELEQTEKLKDVTETRESFVKNNVNETVNCVKSNRFIFKL
jgi:hypothetical protein